MYLFYFETFSNQIALPDLELANVDQLALNLVLWPASTPRHVPPYLVYLVFLELSILAESSIVCFCPWDERFESSLSQTFYWQCADSWWYPTHLFIPRVLSRNARVLFVKPYVCLRFIKYLWSPLINEVVGLGASEQPNSLFTNMEKHWTG